MTRLPRHLLLLACLALVALCLPSAAGASPGQVIIDCRDDGALNRTYSNSDLRKARDNLPSDLESTATAARSSPRRSRVPVRAPITTAETTAAATRAAGRGARPRPTPSPTLPRSRGRPREGPGRPRGAQLRRRRTLGRRRRADRDAGRERPVRSGEREQRASHALLLALIALGLAASRGRSSSLRGRDLALAHPPSRVYLPRAPAPASAA